MDKIENLLQQVSIIQKKYDEIAKITGENFNIFSIMKAESDEVRTHSRIIAEFLNPKGIHNQGSVFLELFFDEIESLKNIKESFDFKNAKVLVEEHIGIINEEYSEGGYIDIVIKDSKNQIVIENKIYAEDQKGQLLRYKNYYRDCQLIYLTLNGKSPSVFSYKLGNGKELNLEEIFLVSYKNNIKNWIEKCLEKMHYLPIIRETLVQYLYLIKKLTNQTINDKMGNEIKKYLISNDDINMTIDEKIKSAIGIYRVVKQAICEEFFNRIEAKTGNNCENYNDKTIGENNSGKWFSKENKVLLWFRSDCEQLELGIVDENDNWDRQVDIKEYFDNKKWEEILDEENINGILEKIEALIKEVNFPKTL